MKIISQLLCASAAMLFVSNVSAMSSGPKGDFLGINISKEHCRMQAVDGDGGFDFEHRGEGKVKYTMNKNFILATCKANYLQDVELEQAIVERADIPCKIAKENPDFKPGQGHGPKMVHFEGFGGFTVTPSGQVIGRCKAEK